MSGKWGDDAIVKVRCELHCGASRMLLLHMQERVQMLILRRAFCFLAG